MTKARIKFILADIPSTFESLSSRIILTRIARDKNMQKTLLIQNLKVAVEDKPVLNGVNLEINSGELHVIMGPNGSGKSSLALTLMGHPKYQIKSGQIEFCKQDITNLKPDVRAKLGLFLAMQNPYEIEGVPLKHLIREAYNQIYNNTPKQLKLNEFNQLLDQKIQELKISPQLAERATNVGFSGGEKKRAEILQMAILQPRLAVLDEIDSGVDVDALQIICSQINQIREMQKDSSFILITHNPKLLDNITPNFVHIMKEGKIVRSGSRELIKEIEQKGFE
jgi:Fe-S cluster assembly ATP-binding protein